MENKGKLILNGYELQLSESGILNNVTEDRFWYLICGLFICVFMFSGS